MNNITFEFACRDDCLEKMVPSDLRALVRQLDEARAEVERCDRAIEAAKESCPPCQAEKYWCGWRDCIAYIKQTLAKQEEAR